MKKIIKIALSITILLIVNSCNNEETVLNEQYETNTVLNKNIITSITNSFNGKSYNKSVNSEFNFNEISEVYNTETGGISYMVNSFENQFVKLAAYPKSNGEYAFLKIEYEIQGNNKNIIYKNPNGDVLVEVLFNMVDETINVIQHTNQNKALADCGQDVADCLTDAYSNHGWYSVGMWVMTAYNPAFGVGAALACAAIHC